MQRIYKIIISEITTELKLIIKDEYLQLNQYLTITSCVLRQKGTIFF